MTNVDSPLHHTPANAEALDRRFMAMALTLGRRGLGRTWPNPSVGAVIVREEGGVPIVVGRGVTQPGGRPHAETQALKLAGALAKGATLYVTLEPCSHHGKTPPCVDAIIAAGIARIVSAIEDANPEVAGRGHARLRAAGIAVDVGIAVEEARLAHAGHFRRVRDGRPHVTLKLAVSADGKAGLAGRRPVAITGEAARDRVHLMRAQYDAIMIGIGTALADNPQLTCRLPGMAERSPVRVVLDAGLRLPPKGALATTARDPKLWVFHGPEAAEANARRLVSMGAEVISVKSERGRLDLVEMLHLLAGRGITRLMIEGGPTVAAALLTADLVDAAVLLHSDKILGPDAIDAIAGMPLTALTQSPRFRLHASEIAGTDRLEFFERA